MVSQYMVEEEHCTFHHSRVPVAEVGHMLLEIAAVGDMSEWGTAAEHHTAVAVLDTIL